MIEHSPDAAEDEKQLDEDTAKGQDSAHGNAQPRLCVQWLWWNLAWDLVRACWLREGEGNSN